jgi:hypothetical protein
MTVGRNTVTALAVALLAFLLFDGRAAQAQLFSVNDGYADDGKYRVQAEVSPYLWLPSVAGSVHFARPRLGTQDFNSGFPTAAELKNSLHAAFMGSGLLRYGPWSAEMDIQYIDASTSSTLATGRFGRVYRVNTGLSLVRVAPGVGYKVYAGDALSVPVMVDARVGFAYLATDTTLEGEGPLGGGGSSDNSFVQPWLGLRAAFVPAPRWRVELAGLVQGLGVENGSWGWGASVVGSYAVTRLIDLDLGFRALNNDRGKGSTDLSGSDGRSFSTTAYGPIAGITFRF